MLLNFLERDNSKKQLEILLSVAMITFITGIFLMLGIILLKNPLIDYSFVVMGIIHFFSIWFLTNIFAATIGTTIALIFKNQFSILISIVIYSLFIWISYSFFPLPNTSITTFLNIFDDNTYIITNELSGVLFNTYNLLDKLFVFLLILIILSLVKSIYSTTLKKRVTMIILTLLIGCATILVLILGDKNIQSITATNVALSPSVPYEVESYNMQIKLTNNLSNEVILTVHLTDDTEKIKLILDNIFSINTVKVNDNTVEFEHKNNMVEISSAHNKDEKITVLIKYQGLVNVKNELGFNTYYVTNKAINLPGEFFYWYPQVLNGESANYNVHIDTPATIYSNLSTEIVDKEYKLSGYATGLNIFAGNYQKVIENGIEYIFPISYTFDSISSQIQTLLNHPENKLSKTEIDILTNKTYRRVIVGVWPNSQINNDIYIYDNTLLLRYIDY